MGTHEPNRRQEWQERQARLKEAFLDLANLFVGMRMKFLRRTGKQPPDRAGSEKT